MVQLADAALPSYCHARPLPCAVQGVGADGTFPTNSQQPSALQDMHLRVRDAVGLAPESDEWPSEQCLQTRELEQIMVCVCLFCLCIVVKTMSVDDFVFRFFITCYQQCSIALLILVRINVRIRWRTNLLFHLFASNAD